MHKLRHFSGCVRGAKFKIVLGCKLASNITRMSHDRICTSNVSVVRINGNIILVGAHTLSSYDVTRFGAGARVFESCKGCVAACFGGR